ncbi:hypothetical protein DMJ13_07275 [halophilic archaeon]|nr:hypothetical protein DMJ13_07275 [halophilic archaeon]
MNRRLLFAFGLLGMMAASAGCSSVLGPGQISQDRLNDDASYDWDTSQSVTFNVTSGNYRAIYEMKGKSSLEVYQHESLGGKQPVEIASVKFRYRNGTVVGAKHIDVKKTKKKTIIEPPAKQGKLAYTAPRRGKTFSVPTYVDERTYEVVLPKGMRVDNFLLSDVSPDDHEQHLTDDRVHLVWDEPVNANSLTVRFYLARDETIFTGIVGVAGIVALLGLAYFRFQIRKLEEKREEMGLNVDVSDDDIGDGGPPPGMQ